MGNIDVKSHHLVWIWARDPASVCLRGKVGIPVEWETIVGWSDGRIRLTQDFEWVHVWVVVCQMQYYWTWNNHMDMRMWPESSPALAQYCTFGSERQHNGSAISSLMISDSIPNWSRVDRLWGTLQCSKPGLWCNVSQKRQRKVQTQILGGQLETDLTGQVWSWPVVSRQGASGLCQCVEQKSREIISAEFCGKFQISFLPSIKSTNSRGSQESLKRWRWASRCSWWTCWSSQAT